MSTDYKPSGIIHPNAKYQPGGTSDVYYKQSTKYGPVHYGNICLNCFAPLAGHGSVNSENIYCLTGSSDKINPAYLHIKKIMIL